MYVGLYCLRVISWERKKYFDIGTYRIDLGEFRLTADHHEEAIRMQTDHRCEHELVVWPGLMLVCWRQCVTFSYCSHCVHINIHIYTHTYMYMCVCVYLRLWWSTRVSMCILSIACHSCCCWVFGNLQRLCVCVFKLLFNFYFLFYSWPNPNATQLCSQPEKESLGDGLPGPGECSHALQLLPTDGREMGLPAWT